MLLSVNIITIILTYFSLILELYENLIEFNFVYLYLKHVKNDLTTECPGDDKKHH
jgi:hypothetical protein